jgi:hypothetical protein
MRFFVTGDTAWPDERNYVDIKRIFLTKPVSMAGRDATSDTNEQENSNAQGQSDWEFTCLSPYPKTKTRTGRRSRGLEEDELDWEFTCLFLFPLAITRNGRRMC